MPQGFDLNEMTHVLLDGPTVAIPLRENLCAERSDSILNARRGPPETLQDVGEQGDRQIEAKTSFSP
jgi:hypothetical protein